MTGILVPAESREDLVGALARLAGDAATRARLGARAREAMIRERSWPRLIQRYVDPLRAVSERSLRCAFSP